MTKKELIITLENIEIHGSKYWIGEREVENLQVAALVEYANSKKVYDLIYAKKVKVTMRSVLISGRIFVIKQINKYLTES